MQQIYKLNQLLIEFYDKLSSWEHEVVKETGYSLAQIHTIEVLGNHGAMRMKELAEKLAITTGTLTVQVDKLVSAKLLVRQPHQEDRRAIVVDLTASGRQLHEYHNTLHLELVKDLSSNLSEEQTRVLCEALQLINREF